MSLTLTVGEEGFLYTVARSLMTTTVNSSVTAVTATDRGSFSVHHRSGPDETSITAYTDPILVTPVNPAMAPFILAQGQHVKVSSDAVTSLPPVGRVFLPVVVK